MSKGKDQKERSRIDRVQQIRMEHKWTSPLIFTQFSLIFTRFGIRKTSPFLYWDFSALALTGVLHSAASNLYSWETLNRANTQHPHVNICVNSWQSNPSPIAGILCIVHSMLQLRHIILWHPYSVKNWN